MMPPVDDIDRIMEIMAAAFDPAFGEAWNRRQVEDALTMGHCHYFLIAPDGAVPEAGEPAAGFFMSRTGFDEEELLLFAVDPAFRRRGLGETMLRCFAEAARQRGVRRLILEMRRGNPAESLYRRFGFDQIGERHDYYRVPDGGRLDALTFAKDL